MKRRKDIKIGKDTFLAIFRSQAPVDKIIVALGTNDLQIKYNKRPNEIISDLVWYMDIVKEMYVDLEDRKKYFRDLKMPEFIYILPINFNYNNAKNIFDYQKELDRQYILRNFEKSVEENVKVLSFNELELFEDGIHLSYNGHAMMARKIEETLKLIKI